MLEGWEVYDYTAILLIAILAAMGVGLLVVWLMNAYRMFVKRIRNGKRR
jgi:uncharacterized integral membrane protein